VSPAVIQTPILDGMAASTVDYMNDKIPMGRVGQPEEVAAVVHFLSSDDASFLTSQCYDVTGGRATYKPTNTYFSSRNDIASALGISICNNFFSFNVCSIMA
ncbi:SDR family oxidoreductase, partial [Candidatus Poribacteria bacterium]|nr:SDR family oxidoreductase [Candidatus Poribacteria bacterium]